VVWCVCGSLRPFGVLHVNSIMDETERRHGRGPAEGDERNEEFSIVKKKKTIPALWFP